MCVREAARLALASIGTDRLRAFFTVAGTMVGITFLMAAVTLVGGMDAYVQEELASRLIGLNTVSIRRMEPVPAGPVHERAARAGQRRPRLTPEDARFLEDRMRTPGILAYAATHPGKVEDESGRAVEGVTLTAASAPFFQLRDLEVAEGRAFSAHEAERGAPVVVLGSDLADELFEGRSPVGRTVRIHGARYRVIGVTGEQEALFGLSLDRFAVAPVRAPLGAVGRHGPGGEIYYRVADASLVAPARAELEGWMRLRHRLHAAASNDFTLETAEEVLEFWDATAGLILRVLPVLVGISLLVGAVVITNIMLVSVTERTREIGVRKSLGAGRRDILLQFMVEAATLSGAGGVLGIALGAGLAYLVSALSPIPARLSPAPAALALLLAVGVGALAGVYPAYRASRLDPIAALRHE